MATATRPGAAAWTAVGMLCLLAVFSYVDRVIISLLAEGIKRTVGLSDVQIGALSGLAFVLLFVTVSLPLARYADLGNRRLLIAAGATLWGAMTICSGFADSFGGLLVCRLGVGLGEAVLVPAALSMMADLFPVERRAGPTSLFFGASIIGGASAGAIGAGVLKIADRLQIAYPGVVAGFADWQIAFMLVGLPALVAGLVFALIVREPTRTHDPRAIAHPTVRESLNYLRQRSRLFGNLFVGVALLQVMLFGMSLWVTPFLIRTRGFTPAEAGLTVTSTIGIGAVIGSFLTPYVCGRILARGAPGAVVPIAMVLGTFSAVFMIPLFVLDSLPWALAAGFVVSLSISGLYTLPMISAQRLAPIRLRAQMAAVYLMCGNIVGAAAGGLLIPWLGSLFEGPAAIGYGNIAAAWLVLPVSLFLLARARAAFVIELEIVRAAERAAAADRAR